MATNWIQLDERLVSYEDSDEPRFAPDAYKLMNFVRYVHDRGGQSRIKLRETNGSIFATVSYWLPENEVWQ